ncbi:uncharacterized protein LOC133190848 [Saccostrea echinata]|uniref:uncharacterized protein LOC133190848 n=1 Tax=Saccostrea echinata TaxID=191078 RepID=UPI002A817B72|nr:uncharacterized protein LOC133190848 [Saccostrea echinata]
MASLVLDQYLRCPVCMDFFADPHRLPCSHCFCKRCLEGVRQHCLSFNCPECRQLVMLDYRGVDGLEKDRRLAAMVDEFAHQQQQSRVCKEHKRTVEGYCETCAVLMCGRCFFSDQHSGHNMGDVDVVAKRKRDEISSDLAFVKGKVNSILSDSDVTVQSQLCALQEQITSEFEQIRELLRQKEDGLQLEAIKLAEKACHGNDKIAKAQELKLKINALEDSITDDGVSFLQNVAELKERVRIEKKLVTSLDSDYHDTRVSLPTLKHGDTELFLMSFRLAPAPDPRLRTRKSSEGSEELSYRLATQHVENGKHSAKLSFHTNLILEKELSPSPAVHAATFLSSGYIVLLDLNSTLLLYDESYALLHELKLEDKAFDVTALSDHMLAVTIGAAKRVELIDVNEETLQPKGKIELDTECFHVSSIDDKIVTGNGSLVSFFNVKGARLKTIIMSGMIQSLYISKSHRKMYLNIRSEYVLCTDMRGNREYKYKHDDLQEIGGVSADNRSLAYACGSKSNNVHQIGPDGRLVRIILSKEKGLTKPITVGFDSTCSKMFLIEKDDTLKEAVKVYSMNY